VAAESTRCSSNKQRQLHLITYKLHQLWKNRISAGKRILSPPATKTDLFDQMILQLILVCCILSATSYTHSQANLFSVLINIDYSPTSATHDTFHAQVKRPTTSKQHYDMSALNYDALEICGSFFVTRLSSYFCYNFNNVRCHLQK